MDGAHLLTEETGIFYIHMKEFDAAFVASNNLLPLHLKIFYFLSAILHSISFGWCASSKDLWACTMTRAVVLLLRVTSMSHKFVGGAVFFMKTSIADSFMF